MCAAAVSCILVRVTDRGPTAVAGFQVHADHLMNMILQQHFTPGHHIINSSMEMFHCFVPAWRSTLEHDRTVEHCSLTTCQVISSCSARTVTSVRWRPISGGPSCVVPRFRTVFGHTRDRLLFRRLDHCCFL